MGQLLIQSERPALYIFLIFNTVMKVVMVVISEHISKPVFELILRNESSLERIK